MNAGRETARCTLCDLDCQVGFVARDLNRRTSPQDFRYHRCGRCGLIFLGDPPADLARYYPTGYVAFPKSKDHLERIARRTKYQLEMVQRFVPSGRLIEIGPGYGNFAWLAKTAGFEVEAIESDAAACEYLTHQVGVAVTRSDVPEVVLSDRVATYDAVVLWHSIEHLPHPWATLRQAAQLLNPGGVILVATPNPAAWQFGVLGHLWPHIDAPRHLWLIPLEVLRGYLEPLGLELISVTSRDPGARRWNRFGWSQAILNVQPAPLRSTFVGRVASRILGSATAFLVRRWERPALKGSAYTAVFIKRRTAEPTRLDSTPAMGA